MHCAAAKFGCAAEAIPMQYLQSHCMGHGLSSDQMAGMVGMIKVPPHSLLASKCAAAYDGSAVGCSLAGHQHHGLNGCITVSSLFNNLKVQQVHSRSQTAAGQPLRRPPRTRRRHPAAGNPELRRLPAAARPPQSSGTSQWPSWARPIRPGGKGRPMQVLWHSPRKRQRQRGSPTLAHTLRPASTAIAPPLARPVFDPRASRLPSHAPPEPCSQAA